MSYIPRTESGSILPESAKVVCFVVVFVPIVTFASCKLVTLALVSGRAFDLVFYVGLRPLAMFGRSCDNVFFNGTRLDTKIPYLLQVLRTSPTMMEMWKGHLNVNGEAIRGAFELFSSIRRLLLICCVQASG